MELVYKVQVNWKLQWKGHKNVKKITHLFWHYWENIKLNGRFLSNFAAFSQCLHFTIKLFFQLEILVKFISEKLRLGNLKLRSLIVTFPDGIPEEFISQMIFQALNSSSIWPKLSLFLRFEEVGLNIWLISIFYTRRIDWV